MHRDGVMGVVPTVLMLVVEDNRANLVLTGAVLRRGGHDVEGFESAEMASEWLATNRPDLILLDIQLPGIDGLTFAERLKAEPTTSSIPLVALSAGARQQDFEVALKAGFDGYICKPIDTRSLVDELRAIMDRHSAVNPA